MLLAFNYFKDLFPLSLSWVNTSWVMRTDVQENNLLIGSVIKILKHSVDIKTLSLLAEVAVSLLLQADTSWNCVVNWPCGGWCVDLSSLDWVELSKELKSKTERSST